ncbi:FixH family protein [Cohnella sp. GCM10020058]|uniref:FixH family protein n=1 Tax=Cohnella sp. GCM10020058 TaxID=3317330 RepID=UPI0036349E2D
MKAYGNSLRALSIVAAIAFLLMLAGCGASGKQQTLKFSEVTLTSEPSPPAAGQATKLIATIDNKKFAAEEAKVQFQINSKNDLPSLIDAVKEGDSYSSSHTFPSAGDYTITIHLMYPNDHFAFTKQLKVGG